MCLTSQELYTNTQVKIYFELLKKIQVLCHTQLRMLLSLEEQEEHYANQGGGAQPPDWAFSSQPNSPVESPAHTSRVWGPQPWA